MGIGYIYFDNPLVSTPDEPFIEDSDFKEETISDSSWSP